MENKDLVSALKMEKLVFDKISFERKGFKNPNSDLELQMNVRIAKINQGNTAVVSLTVSGDKDTEYSFSITVSGFFKVDEDSLIDEEILLNKNAVAILMPYIRSQVSTLTAQPETDCVVLPPYNFTNIMNN